MALPGAVGSVLSIFEYNLIGQLISPVLGPVSQSIANGVNSAAPVVPLSPADLALAVVRNELSEPQAAAEAAQSGINAERFHTLARLTGDAPGPGELVVALRRGIIDRETYDRGIRQGRLRDEWADVERQLGVIQPSPEAMLAAYLEGQLPEAEARDRFEKLGGDPAYFDILFHTQGQAPSPLEAADMARRGLIEWSGSGPDVTSYEQAFLEGPWRNKWLEPYKALAIYLPPPRTITAMYREGSLSHDDAAKLLAQQGVPPELVAAYLVSGSAQKQAKTRELAESTVVELYRDRLVDGPAATDMLTALNYTAEEAAFILSIEDMRVGQRFLGLAVSRLHSLYVGHRIDAQDASAALAGLGVTGSQATDLLAIWQWERAANVRALTPAEIAGAMHYAIIDQPTAEARLVDLGYTPYDAWLYLSVHEKAPLGQAPAVSAVGPPPGP